jgi:hypothetical protein
MFKEIRPSSWRSLLLANIFACLAFIRVHGQTSCAPTPSGLVDWWRAEGNTIDFFGTNNGTLTGTATYGPGMVGQAFVFDGSGAGVQVSNTASLQAQSFTIEAWVRRTDSNLISHVSGNGEIFAYGSGGYGFGMSNNGTLYLSKVDVDSVVTGVAVTDELSPSGGDQVRDNGGVLR